MIRPRSALSRSPGDRRVVRVPVAVGDRDDPRSRELLERRAEGAELGVSRTVRPSRRAWQARSGPVQLVRAPADPRVRSPMLVRLDVRDACADLADRLAHRSSASDDSRSTPSVTVESSMRCATPGDAAVRELTATVRRRRDGPAPRRRGRDRGRRGRHPARSPRRARGRGTRASGRTTRRRRRSPPATLSADGVERHRGDPPGRPGRPVRARRPGRPIRRRCS